MENVNLWKRATITLAVENRLIGGIPKAPAMIEGWLKANIPAASEAERASLKEKTLEELPQAVEDKAAGMWTTFKRDEDGIYIESRQIKAAFKESANILREILQKAEDKKDLKKSRFTGLRAKLAERIFVENDKIRLLRSNEIIADPDGSEERPIHVMTAMGERTALKRTDFVNTPTLSFTVRYLSDGVVDLDLVKVLLDHMSWNGIGCDRSQGNGRFKIVEVTAL